MNPTNDPTGRWDAKVNRISALDDGGHSFSDMTARIAPTTSTASTLPTYCLSYSLNCFVGSAKQHANTSRKSSISNLLLGRVSITRRTASRNCLTETSLYSLTRPLASISTARPFGKASKAPICQYLAIGFSKHEKKLRSVVSRSGRSRRKYEMVASDKQKLKVALTAVKKSW